LKLPYKDPVLWNKEHCKCIEHILREKADTAQIQVINMDLRGEIKSYTEFPEALVMYLTDYDNVREECFRPKTQSKKADPESEMRKHGRALKPESHGGPKVPFRPQKSGTAYEGPGVE